MTTYGISLGCLVILMWCAAGCRSALEQAAPEGRRAVLTRLPCAVADVRLEEWQAAQAERGYAAEHRSTWIVPRTVPEWGVVVLVHGLNLQPAKMNALAYALAQHGLRSLRVTLHGHGCPSWHDFRGVVAADWLDDVWRAYSIAAAYAQHAHLPLYYVGYSLGGSLVVELLHRCGVAALPFDAMVLLAPGLAFRPGPAAARRAVPWLMHLPGLPQWTPRSRNRPEYACHAGTPLPAYDAEWRATHTIRQRGLMGLGSLPTVIFLDAVDELISWEKIQTLLQEAAPSHWSLRAVTKSSGHVPGAPHHLLIDEPMLGPGQWQELLRQMVGHLRQTAPQELR